MTTVTMRCPNCGMNLEHDRESGRDHCQFCGYERKQRWRQAFTEKRRHTDRVRKRVMWRRL